MSAPDPDAVTLTYRQVAHALGISPQGVRKLCKRRQRPLPSAIGVDDVLTVELRDLCGWLAGDDQDDGVAHELKLMQVRQVRARAELLERERREHEREYLPRAELVELVRTRSRACAAHLDAVPVRLARRCPDLGDDTIDTLREELDRARSYMATTPLFALTTDG